MKDHQANDWVRYEEASLAHIPNNDGDSFRIAFANGGCEDFRLYFVDTPESQCKSYRDGNDNSDRIAEQGGYFGGLTQDETTSLGKRAKELTVKLLSEQQFDVFTKYEEVYDSGRFYCLIRLQWQGSPRWLDEVLVENGVARIITQPTALPDGTSAEKHRNHLRALETKAKKAQQGGWQ